MKEQKDYDVGREAELERFDIRVIRFTNEEVENDIERVRKEIELACQSLKSAHKSCLPEVPVAPKMASLILFQQINRIRVDNDSPRWITVRYSLMQRF